jgi:acyl-CoA reductase-like NAD-dependent aldehyde dehydrogenase
LRAIADVVEANLEELAKLEASDVGKPISDARGEVGGVVECFRCYAVVVDKILDETTPVDGDIDIEHRHDLP